ncbi:MAG TPA: nascent polypeptide-associated complex protein [Thermoprotei archaeon]|nr:nascent polypeptide-associated complex protein [Thermoprotei archaeon]
MPSTNPRELKRMMKRMGIDVKELSNVKSVIIELEGKEIVLSSPQVTIMKIQGQKVYQIIARSERVVDTEEMMVEETAFSDEDVAFVMEQTGVSREKAIIALKEAGGDIAKAILKLTSGG